jgi:hypothetical protein
LQLEKKKKKKKIPRSRQLQQQQLEEDSQCSQTEYIWQMVSVVDQSVQAGVQSYGNTFVSDL